MKDGKNIAEYIELHDGSPRESFTTEDRGKLERAFLFIGQHFGDRAATLFEDNGDVSLTIEPGPDDRCTIHTDPYGGIEVKLTRFPFVFFRASYEYANIILGIQPGGTFEITIWLPGVSGSLNYWLDFPKEEFGRMVQVFTEEFSEGGNA